MQGLRLTDTGRTMLRFQKPPYAGIPQGEHHHITCADGKDYLIGGSIQEMPPHCCSVPPGIISQQLVFLPAARGREHKNHTCWPQVSPSSVHCTAMACLDPVHLPRRIWSPQYYVKRFWLSQRDRVGQGSLEHPIPSHQGWEALSHH